MNSRRFPPPWSVEDIGAACRDGQRGSGWCVQDLWSEPCLGTVLTTLTWERRVCRAYAPRWRSSSAWQAWLCCGSLELGSRPSFCIDPTDCALNERSRKATHAAQRIAANIASCRSCQASEPTQERRRNSFVVRLACSVAMERSERNRVKSLARARQRN